MSVMPGKRDPSFDDLVDELVDQAIRSSKERLQDQDAEGGDQRRPLPGKPIKALKKPSRKDDAR